VSEPRQIGGGSDAVEGGQVLDDPPDVVGRDALGGGPVRRAVLRSQVQIEQPAGPDAEVRPSPSIAKT